MRGYLLTIILVLLAAGPENFFSGTVVSVSTTQVTVRRRALVSNAMTKTFVIDAGTKIEGKLRVKANVTVQYLAGDEGQARAIRIIVR